MTWLIEDGSGVTGANTYIAITGDTGADVDSWCSDRGLTEWGDAGETAKNKAFYASMDYIESLPWKGTKEFDYEINELQFPRTELYDSNGIEITGIPQKLIDALCYGAWAELVTPDILAPIISQSDYVTKEKIDVIEIEYGKTKPIQVISRMNGYIKDYVMYLNGGAVNLIRT